MTPKTTANLIRAAQEARDLLMQLATMLYIPDAARHFPGGTDEKLRALVLHHDNWLDTPIRNARQTADEYTCKALVACPDCSQPQEHNGLIAYCSRGHVYKLSSSDPRFNL